MSWKNQIILIGYFILLLVGIATVELDTQINQVEKKEQVQFETSFPDFSSLLPSEPIPNFHLRGNGNGKNSPTSFEWADLYIGNIFSKHEIAHQIIQNHWNSQHLPFFSNKLFLRHGVLII